MKSTTAAACAGIFLALATPSLAQACSRAIPTKATEKIVPAGRIDQALLDTAVRAEVNFHRCRAGLTLLGNAGPQMAQQARNHSKWMASTQQLTHRSTVAGAATLRQRIRNAGIRIKVGAENIGMVHRYQIDNRHFKIIDSGSCSFATDQGQVLPAHSYASLARYMVDLWMNSPGHRRNILDPRVSRVRTAVAYDPNAQYCGRFWMTQDFVG